MQDKGNEHHHEGKRFENITYEGRKLEGRVFTNCTFYKSSLKGCEFEDSYFDRCTFDDCDLSLMKFRETTLRDVIVTNSKAIGVMWSDADNPFSISFKDSRISFCSFFGKHLKKLKVLNCVADETDFSECNLSQSDFAGTDLRSARFNNTDLTKANFVGAKNYFIDTRTNKIAGAKFSLPGALSFLDALGMELVDEPE